MVVVHKVESALTAYRLSLLRKSRAITRALATRMGAIGAVWLASVFVLSLLRLSNPATPVHNLSDSLPIMIAYSLVITAPVASYLVARNALPFTVTPGQPSLRFAVFGSWRRLNVLEARARPDYGPAGFMASLLVGMLLNVGLRTIEYFLAVPAMSVHAPDWGMTLFVMMTADLAVTSAMYMFAFVMALRSIPLFPRMLALAWAVDILMQLYIADSLSRVGGIPASLIAPLTDLLDGNIVKVLISMLIWLPYLLLSERVNVTYRHRCAAR